MNALAPAPILCINKELFAQSGCCGGEECSAPAAQAPLSLQQIFTSTFATFTQLSWHIRTLNLR